MEEAKQIFEEITLFNFDGVVAGFLDSVKEAIGTMLLLFQDFFPYFVGTMALAFTLYSFMKALRWYNS